MTDTTAVDRGVPASPWRRIVGDVSGGVSAGIVALPTAISCGLLAFAPLGPAHVSAGVAAGIYTGVFVTVIAAFCGGSRFQISGPRSSLAVVLGAMAATLMATPDLVPDGAAKGPVVFALVVLTAFLAGAFQILLGLLRLGTLVKFVPHAVVAGLMNGFAIVILLQQTPIFFGLPHGMRLDALAGIGFEAAAVGAVTMIVMVGTDRFIPAIPGPLLGLIAGAATYHVMLGGGDAAVFAGGVIGRIPPYPSLPDGIGDAFRALVSPAGVKLALPAIVGSAATLALLASVLSLLSAVHADTIGRTQHRSNRELIGQGVANMASAAFGGLPGAGSAARTSISYLAGGRTRLASVAHGVLFLLAATALGPLIGNIPMATVAGLLLVFAVRMVDRDTLGMIAKVWRAGMSGADRETLTELAVILIVTAMTVFVGFVVAAGIGLVIASLLFAERMGRGVVRSIRRGDEIRSRTVRSHHAEDLLEAHGRRIVVLEAQGAIFFGSADQLARTLRECAAGAEIVILDFRLVSDLDGTGLKILRQLDDAIVDDGKVLLAAFLSPDRLVWGIIDALGGKDTIFQGRRYPDADSALAAAEDMLIARLERAEKQGSLPLAGLDAFQAMAPDQLRHIEAKMTRVEFPAGTRIVEQGAPGDAMYFLVSGAASVRIRVEGANRTTRLITYLPGVVFGEMAVLSGEPRSATVTADVDSACWVLTRAAFDSLRVEYPDVLAALLLSVSRELSNRLRAASKQIGYLEK